MLENYRNYSRNFRSLVEVIYCSSLQVLLPADASVHVSTRCMYLLVGKAKEISSLCIDALIQCHGGTLVRVHSILRLYNTTLSTEKTT